MAIAFYVLLNDNLLHVEVKTHFMTITGFLRSLVLSNSFTSENKDRTFTKINERVSLFPTQEVKVLKPDQLKNMDQNIALSNFFVILGGIQNIINFVTSGIETERKRAYRYFSEHYYSYRLKRAVEKGFQTLRDEPKRAPEITQFSDNVSRLLAEMKSQPLTNETIACLSNEKQLKELSHLRKSAFASPIDIETFEVVFHGMGSYQADALPKVIAFVKSFIPPSLLSKSRLSNLENAMRRDAEFRMQITADKESPLAKRKEKLRDLAADIVQDIKALVSDESYLILGGVRNGKCLENPLVDSILSTFLPGDLHEFLIGERSEETVQRLTQQLKTMIWGKQDNVPGLGKKIEETIRKALAKANATAESVLPETFMSEIRSSLKQDLEEILLGPPMEDGAERLGEKVWEKLKEKGIEKVIQETLLGALQSSRQVIEAQTESMNEFVSENLPPMAKPILEIIGLPRGEEEAVWFEFEKQENSKIKLILFTHGAAAEETRPWGKIDKTQELHVPLIYSDIDPEVLDETFIYTLLSYRAIPEWDKSTSFTIKHMHEGLLSTLKKSPDSPTNHRLTPINQMHGEGVWKYVTLFLKYHLGLEAEEFENIYSYHLRLQAFIQMWVYVQDDPDYLSHHPLVAQRFKVAISELSDQGLALYRKRILSIRDLKALFATVWEAEQFLNVEPSPAKTTSSVIVPPDLQEIAKNLVLAIGMTPMQLSLIKEALMVVYGADIEEVIDHTFRDVINNLTTDEMNEARAKRVTENLYTWDGMKKMAQHLKNFRLSLFHIVRLYVGVSKIKWDIFQASLASQFLEFLIVMYFPGISGYTSMSVEALSKLLVCFGPTILKPIVPVSIYQSVRSIYRLMKEILTYMQRRVLFVVVRLVVRFLLGGETASQLSVQARNWNQRMTRLGELSYDIPYGKNEVGHLRLQPLEKPVILVPVKTELSEKTRVEEKISSYNSTEELPRPYRIQLTKDNLHAELSKWILEAKVLGEDQGLGRTADDKRCQKIFYLNRQFRNLKLPTQTTLWNEVDPTNTMKLLQSVIASMGNSLSSSVLLPQERTEVIITVYTVYALMDYLARRSSAAQLPADLKANGCDLGVWLQSPATRVTEWRTYAQLSHTAYYFGFDLEKVYSEEEIDRYRSQCLFNYDGRGESFFTPAFAPDDKTISYRGFRFSKEGKYYQKLLKDPEIQERLKGCGLKPNASEWEQFKVLFKNPRGSKGNPLPEAFEMLRSIDHSAKGCIRTVTFPSYLMRPQDINRGGRWVAFQKVKNCFHAFTGGWFKEQNFDLGDTIYGMHGSSFSKIHSFEIIQRIEGQRKEYIATATNRMQWEESKGISSCHLKERLVNQVMAQEPFPFINLSLQEKRLLELMNSDKEDQIMQVLGFFNRTRGRLRESRFRLLFDLLVHRLGAFQCQMKQRSDLPKAMGSFFKDALEHFECQDDIETCLYLTKIGQELRQAIGSMSLDPFPDFRAFIRYRLIPRLRNLSPEKRIWKYEKGKQDLIIMSYYHLILTYGSLDSEKVNDEERNKVIEDIARLVYTLLPIERVKHSDKTEIMIKADEVVFLWEPYIKKTIRHNSALRKEVIESVLRDVGLSTMVEEEDIWEGTYPVFSNGRITLDLTHKTQTNCEVSIETAKERAEQIIPNLGAGIYLGKQMFSFPNKKVLIEFSQGTYKGQVPCTLHRQFAGIDYEFLPKERQELLQAGKSITLSEGEELWLERPRFGQTRHLLCTKGEEKLWRRPVRETRDAEGNLLFEVRWNRKVIEGVTVKEVNLADEQHGLALLNWFEDEKEIKAYAHVQHPDQLAFIEFPKKGLRFEVREHGGALQAMALGEATGYFLSKSQRNEHLLKYGKYLLLENTLGKKKVYIVTKSLQALMADFVLSTLGRMKISPLIEHYISALTQNILNKENQLLSFDLDANGNLTTSDSMGLAYLALFNFISGDKETSLRYFAELEDYGKKYPFPQKIYEIFELMYLPLLCGQDRFSREMSLRLGAIQAENELIQHSEETGGGTVSAKHSPISQLLKWILLQVKYTEYLKGVKGGIPATLNDFQELFLLSGMSYINQQYYQRYVGRPIPDALKEISKSIGIGNLANSFLFSPEVIERYHTLCLQFNKGSQIANINRGLIFQALHAAFSKAKEETKRIDQTKDRLSEVVHLVDKTKNSALFRTLTTSFDVQSFYREVEVYPDLATLPTAIWEVDQVALRRYFPLYYRLVKNERPWGIDKILFSKKRAEFLRTLVLMHGNDFSNASLQREILQVISSGSRTFSFPSACYLETMILKRQKLSVSASNEETKHFETFILHELVSICSKTLFSRHVLESNSAGKVLDVVKKVGDVALYFIPGFFLPFSLRVARLGKEMISLVQAIRSDKSEIVKQSMRVGAHLGDVVAGTLYPEYEIFSWGFSFLPWISRTLTLYRGMQHEKLRQIELSEAITSRARSELRQKPIEKVIVNRLKKIDGAINREFNDLFDEFFNSELKLLSVDPTPVAPYVASPDKEALNKAFDELNCSLEAYYARPLEKQLQIKLKKGKEPLQFVRRVQEITQQTAKHLKKEEEKIVELIHLNKRQLLDDKGMQIMQKINCCKFGRETLSFQQIYELFTQCDDEAFLKRTELNLVYWKDLKTRLYQYQIIRRRFNFLFNQIDQLKGRNLQSVEEIARELKRHPAYDLGDNIPEIIVRAKLSYEVALEFMLCKTAKQNEQLDRLLLTHFSEVKKSVLEQIMGTGKTFLVPISDRVFADGESIVFNVVIDPVAPSNFDLFIGNTKKAFGQIGMIFRFNRSMIWTTRQLWAFERVLQRALYLGEHMNARRKDLQAFDLRFLEEALDVDGKFEKRYGSKKWKQRLEHYRNSLQLLREKGIENSDEKHKLDEPNNGILNFPLGKYGVLQEEEIQLMNEVMLLLLTTSDFQDYITIKAKRPEKLPAQVYRDKIKATLADRIASLEMLEIPEKHRTEFVKYLKGEATSIPNFVKMSPHKRAIGQAKGCVTVLLEYALQCVINVDFTVSKLGNGEYTRPASGNDDPLEDSTDLRPDIHYLKTLMRLFQTRLKPDHLKKLVMFLREQAKLESSKLGVHKQETPAGRFFALYCPGYQIDTWQPKDLAKIMEKLNQSDRVMTLYATHFIASDIKFYEMFLSSNFANFHSMFGKKQYSRTGTPKNWRCYPHGTEILSYSGTEGESVHILEKKLGHDSIHILEESDPKPALREVIYRFFHPNPNVLALIDLDPICNNMSAEEINEEFQRYINEHRPELQGVAFYDKNKNLVIAEKGSKRTIPLAESDIPPSKRISLFTHTQTIGSDIKQDKVAEAVLTVGENITWTDLVQAYDRMQEARHGEQKVSIVLAKRAQHKICKMLRKEFNYLPTIRDIIAIAVENEMLKLDPNYYLAGRYLMHDILRRAILDKAQAASTIEEMVSIIRKFSDVFIMKTESDPFEAYGYIDITMDPEVVLQEYRDSLLEIVRRGRCFSRKEYEMIRKELAQVKIHHSTGKVHVYRKKGRIEGFDQLLSQHVHQSQDQSDESENNQNSNVDHATHIDVNQTTEIPVLHNERNDKTHNGYQWPANLDPMDVTSYFHVGKPGDWLLSGPVPIYSFRDFLSMRKDLAFMADSFSSSIYVTENFAQQRDNRLWFNRALAIKPLGERQPPLYKALVIQDFRKGILEQKILLLHRDEVKFWRDKLRKMQEKGIFHPEFKIALYDFGTRTVTGDEIEQNDNFKRAMTQIRFIVRAELTYTQEEQEILQNWIKFQGPLRMRKAFETLHAERPVGCYPGSDVETIFFKTADIPLDMRIIKV